MQLKVKNKLINNNFSLGYIYGVLYADGVVKVGRSRNPKARIQSLGRSPDNGHQEIIDSIYSTELISSVAFEDELISVCSANGDLYHGREWFSGIDFDKLKEVISSIEPLCQKEKERAIKDYNARIDEMLDTLSPSRNAKITSCFDRDNVGGDRKQEAEHFLGLFGGKLAYDAALYFLLSGSVATFVSANGVCALYPNGMDCYDSLDHLMSDFNGMKAELAKDIGCHEDDLCCPTEYLVYVDTNESIEKWLEYVERFVRETNIGISDRQVKVNMKNH